MELYWLEVALCTIRESQMQMTIRQWHPKGVFLFLNVKLSFRIISVTFPNELLDIVIISFPRITAQINWTLFFTGITQFCSFNATTPICTIRVVVIFGVTGSCCSSYKQRYRECSISHDQIQIVLS